MICDYKDMEAQFVQPNLIYNKLMTYKEYEKTLASVEIDVNPKFAAFTVMELLGLML
jgi:hypothetical protein